MKKTIVLILILTCILSLTSCGKAESYSISFKIPPGTQETFVFADEVLYPTGKKITISCGKDLEEAEVILVTADESLTAGYVSQHLTKESSIEYDTDKGVPLKIGVLTKNNLEISKTVYIEISGVELEIE